MIFDSLLLPCSCFPSRNVSLSPLVGIVVDDVVELVDDEGNSTSIPPGARAARPSGS